MAWTTAGNLKGGKGDPGDPGTPGVSITSGAVQTDGTLLLNLSSGGSINVGVVRGTKGEDGTSVTIVGSVASAAALPTTLTATNAGDGYITQDDGHLHVWDGDSFTDVGTVKGPKGDPGVPGDTGPRGSKWFTGTGVPDGNNTAGSLPGDLYLDIASGDVYGLD